MCQNALFFYLIFNLLDQNHKEVRLVINYMAGFVLINVSDNYAQVNREPDGKFISTKKNHLGIGMKNVQRTVEKYDGIYSAEVNGDRFIVKITIPYVKKRAFRVKSGRFLTFGAPNRRLVRMG